MILSSVHNRTSEISVRRLQNEPYLVINMVFAGIIMLILLYSLVFSPEKDNYPVPCIHEKITGEKCPSCGLSHSLSLILRVRIGEAYNWNNNGMRVFLFLISQIMLRIFFSRSYIKYPQSLKHIIILDVTGSLILFLITFMPFMVFIFRWL